MEFNLLFSLFFSFLCILNFMSVGGPGQLKASGILSRPCGSEKVPDFRCYPNRGLAGHTLGTWALTWSLQPASVAWSHFHGSWGLCSLFELTHWPLSLEKPLCAVRWVLHSLEPAMFIRGLGTPFATQAALSPQTLPLCRMAWYERSRFADTGTPNLISHGLCDGGHVTQPL